MSGEGLDDATLTSKSGASTSWGLTDPSEANIGQTPLHEVPEAATEQSSILSGVTTAKKDTELLYIQMEYCPQTLHTVLNSGATPASNTAHLAWCRHACTAVVACILHVRPTWLLCCQAYSWMTRVTSMKLEHGRWQTVHRYTNGLCEC